MGSWLLVCRQPNVHLTLQTMWDFSISNNYYTLFVNINQLCIGISVYQKIPIESEFTIPFFYLCTFAFIFQSSLKTIYIGRKNNPEKTAAAANKVR